MEINIKRDSLEDFYFSSNTSLITKEQILKELCLEEIEGKNDETRDLASKGAKIDKKTKMRIRELESVEMQKPIRLKINTLDFDWIF